MDIKLNAEVQCADGSAGHVSRLILNPIKDELTHIVVKHNSREFEVEVSHITSTDDDEVKLDCSRQYLHGKSEFTETEYLKVPREYYGPELGGSYYYMPYVTMETVSVKHEHIPGGEQAFTRGTPVFAENGHIGQVDELVVDPDNRYRITHVVLREGHLWGQKDVVIGVEQVKNIDTEGVHLKLTKAQVEALPTLPIKRHFGLEA